MFLLAACADLPEGWEDAERIADFSQSPCSGDPYEGPEATVTTSVDDGATAFVYDAAQFRCSQDVEGFARIDGDVLGVLVQPVDMNPSSIAKCDCLYRLEFTVPEWDGAWEVWRRWDAINDPNDPELVATSED